MKATFLKAVAKRLISLNEGQYKFNIHISMKFQNDYSRPAHKDVLMKEALTPATERGGIEDHFNPI